MKSKKSNQSNISIAEDINKLLIFKGFVFGLKKSSFLCTFKIRFPKDYFFFTKDIEDILKLGTLNNKKIDDGMKLMDFILESILLIQKDSKMPIFEKGKIIENKKVNSEEFILRILFPYEFYDSTRKILNFLLNFFISYSRGKNYNQKVFDVKLLINELKQKFHQGINQLKFFEAANDLKIPYSSLVGNVYRFGYGSNSRLLESSFTDKTNVLAVTIARQKHLTNKVLKDYGLPVPFQKVINSPEDGLEIIKKISYPVVVKPADNDGGRGVFAGLKDEESFRLAYKEALKYSKIILLEKHIFGKDYRMTVFQGKLIKTLLRVPGGVTGNGINNIKELVHFAQSNNQIQRRSKERGEAILNLDSEAKSLLKDFNMSENYIPSTGEYIQLRRKANAYSGGLTYFIDESKIHPDNILLAQRAAEVFDLDLAGVDLLIEDISKSWMTQNTAICEINSQPQIGNSDTKYIYHFILKNLLNSSGKIPIFIFLEEKFKEKFEEKLLKIKNFKSLRVGKLFDEKIYIKDSLVAENLGFYDLSKILLNSREVDIAFIHGKSENFSEGFPCEYCDLLYIDSKNFNIEFAEKFFNYCKNIIIDEEDYKKLNIDKFLNINFIVLEKNDFNNIKTLNTITTLFKG